MTIVSAIISSSTAARKGKKWPPISFLDVFSTPILHVLDTTTHKILTNTGDDDTRQQGIVFRKCLSQSDGNGCKLNNQAKYKKKMFCVKVSVTSSND